MNIKDSNKTKTLKQRQPRLATITISLHDFTTLQSQLTQAIARIHALEELGFEPKQYENLKAQLTRIQSANESQAEVIGMFEDAVGPDLCISEALDGIRKIKLQLTQAQADNARLTGKCYEIECQWKADVASVQITLTALQAALTQAHKERDEAVAACAVMRGALKTCSMETLTDIGWPQSLSTDCGRAFLERIKEAEWLLSQPLLPTMSKQSELTEYHRRLEAFKKGGVK